MGNIETFALKQMYLYLSLAEIILEGVFLVKLTYFHHYLERIAGVLVKCIAFVIKSHQLSSQTEYQSVSVLKIVNM